jgi:hemerythrin-like metal-binding protein
MSRRPKPSSSDAALTQVNTPVRQPRHDALPLLPMPEDTPMSRLTWSDALLLGLQAMDDTHREFVDLLAQVDAATDDHLVAAWAALVEHTDHHFSAEDDWMRRTGFAPGNCHSTQHAVVLSVLRQGLAQGREGRPEVIRQLAGELAAWFPQHAQTVDAALAQHLRHAGFDTATGTVALPSALPAAAIHGCGSATCAPAEAG